LTGASGMAEPVISLTRPRIDAAYPYKLRTDKQVKRQKSAPTYRTARSRKLVMFVTPFLVRNPEFSIL
jgi:hypothetical protein